MTAAVGKALQRADFRSKQSYQMCTNRFRNQENGDCLLQWSPSITKMGLIGLWLWRHYEAYCLWSSVLFCPGLPRRRIQRPIVRLKKHPEIRSFEILTAVSAAVSAFRNMEPWNLANRRRHSGGTKHLHCRFEDRCRNIIVRYTNLYFIIIIYHN